jgi:hypothetical protein
LLNGGIAVGDETRTHLFIRRDTTPAFRTSSDMTIDIRGFVLWKLTINPRNQLS